MKTKVKIKEPKKIEFIPKYKVWKKYYPLFKNDNLRNNQNYVLWNKDNNLIQFYSTYTFKWWSILRVISKNWLIKFRNKKIQELWIIVFIFIKSLLLAYLWLVQLLVFSVIFGLISFFGSLWLIYEYFKKRNKNIITIKDKNKYIILNKWKIKSQH